METYVRGFSYMPTNKVELVDIQDALERTWRHTRRERLKQREQKIWEEFVKEKDIVSTVCEDDQYQFLDQLPEACVQEIIKTELTKIKNAKQVVQEPKVQEINVEQTVIETVENEKDDTDIFHIFDEERDQQSPVEDGVLNDSTSPPATVRERQSLSPGTSEDVPLERLSSGTNTLSTGKSSENFTNIVESSIYCAKVKELRLKINDEVLDMVSLLDRGQLFAMEKEDITRMIKRSAEFCSRFNRIYLYQLQRQMQDIKRNNNLTLPFAKHTQFQSQMVRIVSLHQNMLQSFQVFRKSMEQTCCVRESVSALGALLGAARGASAQCAAVSHPRDLAAAQLLYEDNLLASCDQLEQFVNEYAVRCEEFLMSYGNVSGRRKKSKEAKKTKKRPLLNMRNNSKNNSEADARLSMYSLGTVRLNTKSSSSKDMQCSGANKSRCTVDDGNCSSKSKEGNKSESKSSKCPKSPKSPKRRRSPRSRRPLMRDPHAGKARAARTRALRDDIPTMVEGVLACTSTHMLTEDPSLQLPPKRTKPVPKEDVSRKSLPSTPRKQKTVNPKPSQGVIQEPQNFTKPFPASKTRNNNKNSNKEEEKREDDYNKKEEEYKKEDENYVDSEKTRSSVDSAKLDKATSDMTKSKSQKTRAIKLEPIKSAPGKPAAVKLETTIHSELPYVEPLDIGLMKPESRNPESPNPKMLNSPLNSVDEKKTKKSSRSPDQCEVTRLLQQLCSGDTSCTRKERTTGTKNAQLLHVNGTSPRPQPSTPQLLRILEETIQKKVPKSLLKKSGTRDVEKYRLSFNIDESVSNNMFQYRTKFVQHMLTSPMYANSAVGKPWEMIGSVSEQIIDELLISCVKDMELNDYILALYKQETS